LKAEERLLRAEDSLLKADRPPLMACKMLPKTCNWLLIAGKAVRKANERCSCWRFPRLETDISPSNPDPDMTAPKKPTPSKALQFKDLIAATASPDRWRIFMELAKGEPLPSGELARRVGMTLNAASKLVLRMHRAGLLERRFGNVYRIPEKFLVPGEAKLDFGPMVVRLDYLEKNSS
jgi:hypothetical protein